MTENNYRIIETHSFPNAWKVTPAHGIERNATYLFHPTKEKAQEQIEKMFKGKVLETIYLEN